MQEQRKQSAVGKPLHFRCRRNLVMFGSLYPDTSVRHVAAGGVAASPSFGLLDTVPHGTNAGNPEGTKVATTELETLVTAVCVELDRRGMNYRLDDMRAFVMRSWPIAVNTLANCWQEAEEASQPWTVEEILASVG
jgi:hypothetical protein